MRAVNDNIHVVSDADTLILGTNEHRNHKYINQPEGEMDMMIGFFLMNGVCIVFFLLFGLCVIFSCLRNFSCCKSKFVDIEKSMSPPPKANFKSIVQQVVRGKAEKKEEMILKETPIVEPPPVETRRKSDAAANGSRRSSRADASAVIRHNLLGPLSFDDLYYM